MNTYKTSTGERLPKSVIDARVRKAKKQKIQLMIASYNYVFCEECGRSGGMPLDCSHDIPVKECQESGRSELAYDVSNITILCRNCHSKKDGLDIRFK